MDVILERLGEREKKDRGYHSEIEEKTQSVTSYKPHLVSSSSDEADNTSGWRETQTNIYNKIDDSLALSSSTSSEDIASCAPVVQTRPRSVSRDEPKSTKARP